MAKSCWIRHTWQPSTVSRHAAWLALYVYWFVYPIHADHIHHYYQRPSEELCTPLETKHWKTILSKLNDRIRYERRKKLTLEWEHFSTLLLYAIYNKLMHIYLLCWFCFLTYKAREVPRYSHAVLHCGTACARYRGSRYLSALTTVVPREFTPLLTILRCTCVSLLLVVSRSIAW